MKLKIYSNFKVISISNIFYIRCTYLYQKWKKEMIVDNICVRNVKKIYIVNVTLDKTSKEIDV